MGRPWVTHLKMGNPWVPMGTHLVYCEYLFSNQMLSDQIHIDWKLHYFYIYSYKQHSQIGNVSRDIEGFLINPQLKCFEIFLIFHGLLLWLLKKIVMKIFVNRSQESLEKNAWVPIAMLWAWLKKYNRILFTKELFRMHKSTVNDFRDCFHTNSFYKL